MSAREAFVQAAIKWVGKPYCTPSRETCVDCSGLVRRAYADVAGYSLSPDSHVQYNVVKDLDRPPKRGDLCFYDTANGSEFRSGNRASHVLILTDSTGLAVSAQNPDDGIKLVDTNTTYWKPKLLKCGTLVFNNDTDEENPDPLKKGLLKECIAICREKHG